MSHPRGAPAPKPLERSFVSISAAIFIDASYEGDLLAAAGVSHRSDREGQKEFGEAYAGVRFSDKIEAGKPGLVLDPYVTPGDPSSGLVPLISKVPPGEAGERSPFIQAYNFRLCLVQQDPIPMQPGSDYSPTTYELLARLLTAQAAAGSRS